MNKEITKILEEYSSKYANGAFYLKSNTNHSKAMEKPILFIFLGSSALQYKAGIEEYCSRYFSNLNGMAFLSIDRELPEEKEADADLNNNFFMQIPQKAYSGKPIEDRKSIAAYADTEEFLDAFEDCIGSIVRYFMECSNIYNQGGEISVHIVLPVHAPEAGIVRNVVELLDRYTSNIYNSSFTLFSLYDDLNIKKEVNKASYITFDEVVTEYENKNNVIVLLIGNKKLNGLFDRPSDMLENHCHLMVLAVYISTILTCSLYPINVKPFYSLGISNLKIFERNVGLTTLVCLLKKVLNGISDIRGTGEFSDMEAEIHNFAKGTAGKASGILRQMEKALFKAQAVNSMNISLGEAEKKLFDNSLADYFDNNFSIYDDSGFEGFIDDLAERITSKNLDADNFVDRLTGTAAHMEEASKSIGKTITEAGQKLLSTYNMNLCSGKQIRELIIKHVYFPKTEKYLMDFKIRLLNELAGRLKARRNNLAFKYHQLKEFLYDIEYRLEGNSISGAISNYYKSSVENDIRVTREFVNKSINRFFNDKCDAIDILQGLCNDIVNDSLFVAIGNTQGMDEQIIRELLSEFNKKSSPYCFTLQIGANMHTQKFYFGNSENILLGRLLNIENRTVLHDENSGDSVTMLQIFTIDDFYKIEYVNRCKHVFDKSSNC